MRLPACLHSRVHRISPWIAGLLALAGCALAPHAPTPHWRPGVPMLDARAAHAVAANESSIIAVAGTNAAGRPVLDVERFDGTRWTRIATLPTEAAGGLNAPAAAFLGDALVLSGGFSATSNRPVANVWALDSRNGTWRPLPPMPAPRGGHAMVAWKGRLHIVGGGNDRSTLADHLAYDPATGTWRTLAPLPRSKGSPALVVAGGELVALGGRSGWDDFGDAHRYDEARDQWQPLASIAPRGTAGAVALCGRVWLIGGESQAEKRVLDRVETMGERALLDGAAWLPGPPLPTPRAFARAVVFKSRVHVVGGAVAYGASHQPLGSAVVEVLEGDCH
ncbi:MAG: hypothetical protein JNK75_00120 [Betaproteobacteria bacterium]|nr:hypothetical protein [Betaproteobacteria bacterium]